MVGKYIPFFLLALQLLFSSDYSIAFVHVGSQLPHHLPAALAQARLFNPHCPIYLIASQEALPSLDATTHHITLIPTETLPQTQAHAQFLRDIHLSGLFRYASERFFYLDEFATAFDIPHLFHMENDVMIYVDLEESFPSFQHLYPGKLAATFDCDHRCIPGFVYVSNPQVLRNLTQYIASQASTGKSDMEFLSDFKNAHPEHADYLPIVPPSYADEYPLQNLRREEARNPSVFSSHFSSFQSVFDAAALGQFLGGIDPIHNQPGIGFINETCLFNPAYFTFSWEKDSQGRQVPYLQSNQEKVRINNLHIHCKNLSLFSSLNEHPPAPPPPPLPLPKVAYSFTPDPIDVVIVVARNQSVQLEPCIQSIRKQGKNIKKVYVVSEAPLTELADWVSEKNFPFSPESIAAELAKGNRSDAIRLLSHPRSQVRPVFYQLLRLYAPLTIPEISPNVLVLEPETQFLEPVEWMNDLGEPLLSPLIPSPVSHFSHSFHLFPDLLKAQSGISGTAHHMLFQKPVLEDLLAQLQLRHGVEGWKAILRCIRDPYQPSFSEFEIYHHFLLLRMAR